MLLPKVTGNLFRAGRALAGLTRDDLANRAGLSRDVLRTWEVSGDSIVPAQYQMLCRAVEALEARDHTPGSLAGLWRAAYRPLCPMRSRGSGNWVPAPVAPLALGNTIGWPRVFSFL